MSFSTYTLIAPGKETAPLVLNRRVAFMEGYSLFVVTGCASDSKSGCLSDFIWWGAQCDPVPFFYFCSSSPACPVFDLVIFLWRLFRCAGSRQVDLSLSSSYLPPLIVGVFCRPYLSKLCLSCWCLYFFQCPAACPGTLKPWNPETLERNSGPEL